VKGTSYHNYYNHLCFVDSFLSSFFFFLFVPFSICYLYLRKKKTFADSLKAMLHAAGSGSLNQMKGSKFPRHSIFGFSNKKKTREFIPNLGSL